MNLFDVKILNYFNQFSQNSWKLDNIILVVSDNHLLKGGVLSTIIWWAWLKNEDRQSHHREYIISTIFSSIVAMAFARTLALTLPFRIRPLREKSLHFLLPYGLEPTYLERWSSFPSDHAVLFFALSAGLLFISRRVGAFALVYTTLMIAFPRMYLGLHYPTDIIAGAIIGITIALIGNIYLVKNKNIHLITEWSDLKPNLFYPLFFLLTYQIADNFDSSRVLAIGVLHLFWHSGPPISGQ